MCLRHTDEHDRARLVERQCAVVLEQHRAGRADLAHDLEVVALHVDVLVRRLIKREECVEVDYMRCP